MSTVSVSQPWWAMVSAAKLLGMASQPLTAAPPDFQIVRRRFSLMSVFLALKCRALRVEFPAGYQVLHGHRVVSRPQAVLLVKLVGFLDLGHVELDAQAGLLGYLDHAADDLQRVAREPLAVLPDPVGVDRGDTAWRGGGHMREHGQRNVEMVVGMRAPGQAPVAAGLRNAHRAGHRPEVRVGQRD